MEEKLRQLEERIKLLEADKIGVVMNNNSDVNVYRAVQRILVNNNNSLGIGTSNPNLNCLVDIQSTNKAFRLPCMTTTQRDAIANPIKGMLIYNTTTNALNDYDGSAWGAV